MIIPEPRASREDDVRSYVRQLRAPSGLSAEEQGLIVAVEATLRGLKIEPGE